MKVMRVLLLAFATLLAPGAAVSQEQEIVVRGDVSRVEIERILDADNLDTARLSPREVAEAMFGIVRGRAPENFWSAYQLHVQAWARLADIVDRVQRQQEESTSFEDMELMRAETAIGTTFDEVERVARSYGARLPVPLVDTRTIV